MLIYHRAAPSGDGRPAAHPADSPPLRLRCPGALRAPTAAGGGGPSTYPHPLFMRRGAVSLLTRPVRGLRPPRDPSVGSFRLQQAVHPRCCCMGAVAGGGWL